MAALTEFICFGRLPTEIRLQIWGYLLPPSRIIGLMVPPDVWFRDDTHRRCPGRPKPGGVEPSYQYRYVVQPRDEPIFPPLHVNQEARAVWLARMSQFQRSCQVVWGPGGPTDGNGESYTVQFDTPFISYETDIFAVLGCWIPGTELTSELGIGGGWGPTNPFVGLDRSLIRHAALCDFTYTAEQLLSLIDPYRLPALERLSLISLGPRKLLRSAPPEELGVNATSEWSEMPVVDVQSSDCEFHDLAPDVVTSHPFLNNSRLNQDIPTSPKTRPLSRYAVFVNAWLWHEQGRSETVASGEFIPFAEFGMWFNFVGYLFEGPDDGWCPLASKRCGVDGHGREEMLQWRPKFAVDHKLLCTREWVETMRRMGVLDECSAE